MASSIINIFGSLKIALAIATLYFYPPDNLFPFIPHLVLKAGLKVTSFKSLGLSSKISSIG